MIKKIELIFDVYLNTIEVLSRMFEQTKYINIKLFNDIKTWIDFKFKKDIENITWKMFVMESFYNYYGDSYADIKVKFSLLDIINYYKKEWNIDLI